MKKHLLVALSLVLLAGPVLAQKNAVTDNASAKTRPLAADNSPKVAREAAKPADYSQEPFVIEEYRTAMRFENDGTGRREVTARMHILSDAGVQALGQIVESYNSANEKLDIKYVRVKKADGQVVTAGPEAVQDMTSPVEREAPMYSDLRQKHVIVPGLRPGDTLEYQTVTELHTPLAAGNFWTEYDFNKRFIILDEQLAIDIPKGRTIKLKTQPGFDPKISDEGDRRIYRWTFANTKRDDDDASTSAKHKTKEKDKDSEHPSVQLSTFMTWNEVGKWYAGLEEDRRKPNDAVAAKAKALTAGEATDIEKVEAIYDFVAKNFRYVSLSFGLGRYQPHSASDVLSNEYGDCKDKHTLLASMLGAAGFKTNSVLINASRKLDPDVPSPMQFDHVISQVQLGDKKLWMDTTTEVAPFQMLVAPLRKKQALVVSADGGHLEETPATLPVDNIEQSEFQGAIDEFGKLTGTMKLTSRGDSEVVLRSLLRRVPQTEWKHFANALANLFGLQSEVTDLKVSELTATHEPLMITFKVSEPNFVDWSKRNTTFSVPMTGARLPEADTDDSLKDPLDLMGPTKIVGRVRIEMPKQFSVRLPVPVTMKRDYAELSSSYKMDGATLIAERTVGVSQHDVARERVRDYLSFRRAVLADSEQVIGLENLNAGKQNSPSIPQSAKADELYESAEAAARARRYDLAVQLYKRVVELEPKHKFAWNNLGLVQLEQRQYDAAIASFKKAIENDPYEQWAYNNMGRALRFQRKYDEAIVAFNKQIEVNPLDRYAHVNLGELYVERKQYKDALPELEKALAITPENAGLNVMIGQCYLNTGDDDKAIAYFDKAVQAQPHPTTWNNIAYELALKKSHLDRARQYAESAVSSMATMLRNAPSIDTPDNRRVQEAMLGSIASYWDTLGWVYFQQDDVANAEKYIRASWSLTQHGEVANHLGQIYEKRGQKDKAAAAYAAALADIPPHEDSREALTRLVPDKAKRAAMISKAQQEMMDERTIHLSRRLKESVSGEFDVVFTSGAKQPEVAFTSGSDKVKGFADDLRASKFDFTFPDETPTRLLRHGFLSCSPITAQCMFVMVPANGSRNFELRVAPLAASNNTPAAERQ